MDMVLFSKRLKSSRENANMKQSELSEKTGVTSATISAYENAKADKNINPSLENVCKIASVLNVSLDWLCGLEKTSNSENNNTDLLYALMTIFDEYTDCETLCDYSLKLNLPTNAYNLLKEYKIILSADKITYEMKETLINALIKKYKDKNLN